MKRNMMRKDFFREIRKSMGRFLSIFFIVALGVSFFAGIRATKPDMILSGDAYADENKMIDIKVVGNYGMTEKDVKELEKLSLVKEAKGTYSVDTLCKVKDNMKVIHVMAHTEDMNVITVEEGRMPEKENECLIDHDFLEATEYRIGDTIKLDSGTKDELTDTLKTTEYKIVGAGSSPLYFTSNRGSSTVGNGSVSAFMVVNPDVFKMDVYSEVFVMVEGAKALQSFTEEYECLVEDAIKQIEGIQDVQCQTRIEEIKNDAQREIQDAKKKLGEEKQQAETEISENENKLKSAEAEIVNGKKQLENGKLELQKGRQKLVSGKKELENGKAELEKQKSLIAAGKNEIQSGRLQLEEGRRQFKEQSEPLTQTIRQLQEQKINLEKQLEENPNDIQLQAALAEVATKLQMAVEQWETYFGPTDRQLKANEELLNQKENELLQGEQELIKAEQQLKASEKEIVLAERELVNSERLLRDTEKKLLDGEKKLQEGKIELEKGKKKLSDQLAEAEAEIKKGEQEIKNLESPEWYVFDRSFIPEYTGYGDNADRIDALSTVFPSWFFLVAALISLTTMTRMVEEQRMHIGTLKALGYNKLSIVKKYLYYALLATVSGSLLGVLVGEKAYPYVIIVAYKVLYVHMPHVIVPYHWEHGIVAMVIAVCCTGGATIFACYKELLAQPSVLMRPEAPKIGKRTLIERIGVLWKRLNFTWKSSLRNLFRYKKRFFMTIFGISGCMGLLLVGYGLQDSLTSVGKYQYKELQTYDANIFVGATMEEDVRQELTNYLKENKDVVACTNANMSSITANFENGEVDAYLTVISDLEQVDKFFTYRSRVSKERYQLQDEGVIVTEKTAKMLGISVDDTIEISEEGRHAHRVKVMAVCENYAGHYIYMTSNLYEELYGELPSYNSVLVKVKDGISSKKLDAIGEHVLHYEGVLNIQYTSDLSRVLDNMLSAMQSVMFVIVIVAGMLSFVVLYNLNNININERRRELATLKVLGFYDLEVAEYVYRENVLLTLIGVVVGCGIGRLLHLFTITTVEGDSSMFGRQIFLRSYIICAVITIAFSVFVNWIMYFKLKKIDMVESLKSVE